MLFTLTKDKTTSAENRRDLFETLMQRSYRQAHSLAHRLTGNSAEAEDLVQETFIRAYRFFHRYDEALPFTSWLYRIMTNAHIDSVRRRGKLRTISLENSGSDGATTWDIPDADAAPDRALLDGTLDECVQKSLLEMTPEFRMAVLLSDVEGLAYEEIAQIMQTSVGTVRSRIHRGRKQLRNSLIKAAPETYKVIVDEL
jgi:RNA polymerase sigma-70 factor, ECF subfamily